MPRRNMTWYDCDNKGCGIGQIDIVRAHPQNPSETYLDFPTLEGPDAGKKWTERTVRGRIYYLCPNCSQAQRLTPEQETIARLQAELAAARNGQTQGPLTIPANPAE